jgi:cyanophycin synthetase
MSAEVLEAPPRSAAAETRRVGLAAEEKMRVLECRAYRGPSIYAYRRVIRVTLDLGKLEQFPTDKLPGFTDALLARIPSLESHTCSYDESGGFVRRMRDGTWLGHVAEHIAIELQQLAGIKVTYGKTRTAEGQEGVYYVVYAYGEERVGLRAAWLALRLMQDLLPPELRGIEGLDRLCPDESVDEDFDFQKALIHLISLASDLALGPTTQSLVDEARLRDIPSIRLDEQSLVQLGYGKYQQRIRAAVTSKTSSLAVEIASDKELTSRLLHDVGLPVPRNVLVYSVEDAIEAAEELGYPVVTKPLDVSHGRGVSLNLLNAEQVRWGFAQAAEHRTSVLVEQFLHGRDFRVVVINDQVVAAAERVPAHVIGDGEHTIAQLIDIVNSDPRRGFDHEKVLTRITVNQQATRLLEQAGYTLETVLPAGERFFLRSTANISTGGTAIDCTNEVHHETAEIARRAARVVGLDIAGIDIITTDITKPLFESRGGIIEVNAGPGFRMHLQPSQGRPRNVAAPVIDMLFPAGTPSRIPIVAITGTNGKTTTARMVAHIQQLHGRCVGLTTTDGIYIDGELYRSGDMTGPWSAGIVLKHPNIDAAVLETARGGILREGLGWDRCDVGAVLNVSNDHLGLRGIETVEDLAYVKSLIVELTRDDGFSVLNADDPLTTAMREKAEGRLIFFSMHGNGDTPEHLREHIRDGGMAVVLQQALNGEVITIYDGDQYIPVIHTRQIPATLEGRARANVANALAATAICYALRIPLTTIRQGLGSFAPTFFQNPGRLNVYDELPFRVILDYGHNPQALQNMRDLVQQLRPSYRRTFVVLGAAGDRRDQDIAELGQIAADMADELVIKEDDWLRGREAGDTAGLLKKAAIDSGLSEDRITTILSEAEAIAATLRRAERGDLVVLFGDDLPRTWRQVVAMRDELRGSHNPAPGTTERPGDTGATA